MIADEETNHNKLKSTATTVVLNDQFMKDDQQIVIGTSTITVFSRITVSTLLSYITAIDKSQQRLTINKDGYIRENAEVIKTGDQLIVSAEDNKHEFKYRLVVENIPDVEDYWQPTLYNHIDTTVNANTPVFPNFRVSITDTRYSNLIEQRKEHYAISNRANDPSVKDSPLVFTTKDVWFYGNAINQAIADVHAHGGGYVVIPKLGSRNKEGCYYTGAINLLSNVNLVISQNAKLLFMRNPTNNYYPIVLTSYEGNDLYNFSPCIYALHQSNIAITGSGQLDGQEDMWNWRPWKKGYWGTQRVDDPSITTNYGNNGRLNQANFYNVPVNERVFTDDGKVPKYIGFTNDSQQQPELKSTQPLKSSFRPNFIEFNYCTNILIDGITIRNTPFWQVHPLNSENILIRNIDIYSNRTTDFETHGWNNDDGIDPESCQNVVLERNQVTVSDDGVAIKAGRNNDGRLRRHPCENIIIRDSVYRNDGGGSAAISIGSEMSAGVKNIFIQHNMFGGKGLIYLLKVKTNEIRGGYVRNVFIRDCEVQNTSISLVQLDSHYRETVPFEHADKFNPQIDGIFLDNITTTAGIKPAKSFIDFASAVSRSPIRNVHYRNVIYHTSNLSNINNLFADTTFIADFTLDNVKVINSATGRSNSYNTVPLKLSASYLTIVRHGDVSKRVITEAMPVKLKNDEKFYFSGTVDRNTELSKLKIAVFLDRDNQPLKVKLNQNGTFSSDYIKFDDQQYWFAGVHYLSVNLQSSINCNTFVYKII